MSDAESSERRYELQLNLGVPTSQWVCVEQKAPKCLRTHDPYAISVKAVVKSGDVGLVCNPCGELVAPELMNIADAIMEAVDNRDEIAFEEACQLPAGGLNGLASKWWEVMTSEIPVSPLHVDARREYWRDRRSK